MKIVNMDSYQGASKTVIAQTAAKTVAKEMVSDYFSDAI